MKIHNTDKNNRFPKCNSLDLYVPPRTDTDSISILRRVPCTHILCTCTHCSLFNRLRMASAVKSSRHFPRNVPSRSTFHSGEFSVYLFLLVLVK